MYSFLVSYITSLSNCTHTFLSVSVSQDFSSMTVSFSQAPPCFQESFANRWKETMYPFFCNYQNINIDQSGSICLMNININFPNHSVKQKIASVEVSFHNLHMIDTTCIQVFQQKLQNAQLNFVILQANNAIHCSHQKKKKKVPKVFGSRRHLWAAWHVALCILFSF